MFILNSLRLGSRPRATWRQKNSSCTTCASKSYRAEMADRWSANTVSADYFTVTDDDLITIPAGMHFPLYPLAALLPLLPAKQRQLSKNDWMFTDTVIACPDPYCGGRFRITRGELKTYLHSEQTLAPLDPQASDAGDQ